MTSYTIDINTFAIRHTLSALGICNTAAEQLLIATTIAQADFVYQTNAWGMGAYGIDEATHLTIWDNYLAFNPELASKVRGLASQHSFLQNPHAELATNLAYATAIAWVIYQSRGINLPQAGNGAALAECWSQLFCHGWQNDANKQRFASGVPGLSVEWAA